MFLCKGNHIWYDGAVNIELNKQRMAWNSRGQKDVAEMRNFLGECYCELSKEMSGV